MSMTRKEFIDKYGSAEVKFLSRRCGRLGGVYEYSGVLPDGGTITISVAASLDDFHREVVKDKVETVAGLNPYEGVVSYEDDEDGDREDNFHDYY